MSVKLEKNDGVWTLAIDRPDRRNALNNAVIEGLANGVVEASHDRDCKVLVIAGEGEHFCAGRDLGDADRTLPLEHVMAYDELYTSIFSTLHRMAKPSVSVVRGYAVAGGFTIAMACDFVLADTSAKFGALEMKGGFPAAVNTAVLTHKAGPRFALELLLNAGIVPADQLYRMGLVNRLAAGPEALAEEAARFIGDLAALDPIAVKLTKETHRAVATMPFDEALLMAKQLNSLMMTSGKIDEAAEKLARERAAKKGG